MKKLLLVALAVVGLASCVQTEELSVANNNEAIAFDTFVDNATKGQLYTTANLDHFKVYGTISQNGAVVTNIFPGVPVTKGTNGWGYSSEYTQYWIPGFTYDFTGIVDGEVAVDTNGMPATITTQMAAQEDVLYATVNRKFNAGDQASKVGFNFAHLLSKAKFTVKNTISEGQNFVYNIESVKIINADATAVYNVATGVWSANGAYEADYEVAAPIAQNGEISSKDILLVPGTKELAIAIKYNLKYNTAVLVNETKNLTAVLTLEKGKAYNFVVEFGNPGEEIEFDVTEVLGWETDNLSDFILEANGFGKEVNTGIYHIQNLAGLKYFAAQVNGGRSFEGQTVVLDNDIDISATTRSLFEWTPIGANSSKYFEGTFDGQDHTIKNFQVNREGHAGLFGYARATFKNLTIENVNLVANHYAGALVGQGYVRVDRCHAKSVNVTVSVANGDYGDKAGGIVGQLLEGATLGISNSTVENVTIKGYRDLGGVAGMAHNNNFVKNCSATNVTIEHVLTNGYQSAVPTTLGGIVGRYGSNVTYEGCTEENVLIANVVYTAEELAEVVNGATKDITVVFANDLQGAITLNKNANPDVDVLILGNNKKFAGKIHIWGAGGATSTMTIKGVNFVVDGSYTSDEACIYTLGNINGTNSYARNVTIDGCTFSGTGETVAAIRHNVGGTNDWTIKNCTVKAGMHSFLQIANVNSGLVVENCKAYSKNGVNLNQTHGATFTGCEFDVKGYAVRVGVNQNDDSYNNEQYTFTNCQLKSQCNDGDAVVVVRGTAQDATLNFVESVVEGTTRIGGAVAGKTKVYFDGVEWVPGGYSVDAKGNYHIYSAEGWLAVANENANKFSYKTIYLENDIDFRGISNIKPIVFRVWEAYTTFDGQNHTVSNIFMAAYYTQNNQALFDGLITVKNLNVVDTHVYGQSRVGIIGAQLYGNIENCHVQRSRAYGYVYQVGGIVGLHSSGSIKNCSVEDSTIECYHYGAVGAIAGCLNESVSGKITGCSVKNCSLIKEGPLGKYPEYDPLFGVLAGDIWVARNFEFSCDIENVTIKGAVSSQLYGDLPAGSTVTFNGVQQ